MPNYLKNIDQMDELGNAFEERKSVTINIYGKKIQVYAFTTLEEIEEEYGTNLDMIDIFRADWKVNE
ncbi:hypothetical protein JOC34_000592 [Virgibacillus halotolerans]|uniref:hypothetical protein n=1 Tax=Virgibacillus halotolerans TaxID=1071053 RepID=UPI001961A23B|nr:hypothetical protein [Virgibacillus halotolerans]MBM7598235.1 hypothetical protein [Virgibacillus halotolerans]